MLGFTRTAGRCDWILTLFDERASLVELELDSEEEEYGEGSLASKLMKRVQSFSYCGTGMDCGAGASGLWL
jgi:hypothetical protein